MNMNMINSAKLSFIHLLVPASCSVAADTEGQSVASAQLEGSSGGQEESKGEAMEVS